MRSSSNSLKNFVLLAVLMLTIAACTAPSTGGAATPTAPAPPTAAPAQPSATSEPATQEPAPTEAPAPTEPAPTEEPGDDGALLPAPLYYLSAASGTFQIWRMERDGVTAMQITNEPGMMEFFDVSPVDGSLAYVSQGQLVVSAADNTKRTVLVDAPAPDANNMVLTDINSVVWAPDGQSIWYSSNGIYRVAATGGEPELIVANDEVTPSRAQGPFLLYSPVSWSPDGQTLLVRVGFYPEGGSFGLLDAGSSEVRPLIADNGLIAVGGFAQVCCNAAWSSDGQSILFASDIAIYTQPGLSHVDVATGEVTRLVADAETMPGSPFPATDVYIANAAESADGTIFALRHAGDLPAEPMLISSEPTYLFRVPAALASDPAAWEELESTPLRAREALWSPESALPGLVVPSAQNNEYYEQGGDLLWVPTDGSDLTPLGQLGKALRWGPMP